MKVSNKKIISVCLVGMSALVLSCCKSTDKNVEENLNTEENVVREVLNKNSVSDNAKIPLEQVEPVIGESMQTVPDCINAIYRNMIQDMKMDTAYPETYKVQNASSLSFPWLESLNDDGKMFYAVGASGLCNGRSTAKKFAESRAYKNLKAAAIQISGNKKIDVFAYKIIEACYKKVETDEGNVYYTASVLIGIDRNLVVKN